MKPQIIHLSDKSEDELRVIMAMLNDYENTEAEPQYPIHVLYKDHEVQLHNLREAQLFVKTFIMSRVSAFSRIADAPWTLLETKSDKNMN